ncbi:MAG: DHH family phosphoesterase, partial [Longimicrobiales bacterium]
REVWRWVDGTAPDEVAGHHHFEGDPARAQTYVWAADATSVTAVIELRSDTRARAVTDAIRAVRPDAAVLMLCDGCDTAAGDGTVARSGRLHSVLRIDLDEELQWLEAQRCVHRLRGFAADAAIVPVLVHADPDPDAISSALAVRVLLRRAADSMPIVTLGAITRPENRRMAELLKLRVTQVTEAELRGFARLIVVDSQPRDLGADGPAVAVIDHHPILDGYHAEFFDVRPELGATATMLTQYLRADDARRVTEPLATALLYGIRIDTDSLRRGVTDADVEAYAFLQERASRELLLRIERPSYSLETARALGTALSRLRQHDDVAVAYLGRIAGRHAHSLADLADFCVAIEQVNWAVACAIVDDALVVSIRQLGSRPGAGELVRALIEDGGSGGGHPTMARAVLPIERAAERFDTGDDEAIAEGLLSWIVETLEKLRSDQSSSASPSSAGA